MRAHVMLEMLVCSQTLLKMMSSFEKNYSNTLLKIVQLSLMIKVMLPDAEDLRNESQ